MEPLEIDCPIVGCARITRDQALAFSAGRPIAQVAGQIFDCASSMNIDPAFALAEAIKETGWGTLGFCPKPA